MASPNERSIVDILQDIVGNIQEIIRSEVRLAKVEVREELRKAGKSFSTLGAGVVLALYGLGFLLLAIVYALQNVVAAWLSALIVALAIGAGAAALISLGRRRLKRVNAVPARTIETVKENVQWAKQQVNSKDESQKDATTWAKT